MGISELGAEEREVGMLDLVLGRIDSGGVVGWMLCFEKKIGIF